MKETLYYTLAVNPCSNCNNLNQMNIKSLCYRGVYNYLSRQLFLILPLSLHEQEQQIRLILIRRTIGERTRTSETNERLTLGLKTLSHGRVQCLMVGGTWETI